MKKSMEMNRWKRGFICSNGGERRGEKMGLSHKRRWKKEKKTNRSKASVDESDNNARDILDKKGEFGKEKRKEIVQNTQMNI